MGVAYKEENIAEIGKSLEAAIKAGEVISHTEDGITHLEMPITDWSQVFADMLHSASPHISSQRVDAANSQLSNAARFSRGVMEISGPVDQIKQAYEQLMGTSMAEGLQQEARGLSPADNQDYLRNSSTAGLKDIGDGTVALYLPNSDIGKQFVAALENKKVGIPVLRHTENTAGISVIVDKAALVRFYTEQEIPLPPELASDAAKKAALDAAAPAAQGGARNSGVAANDAPAHGLTAMLSGLTTDTGRA